MSHLFARLDFKHRVLVMIAVLRRFAFVVDMLFSR